jgi:hypothetical protein
LTLWHSRRVLPGSAAALVLSLAACTTVGLGTLVVYQMP